MQLLRKMRRCSIEVSLSCSLGIRFRVSGFSKPQVPDPETRNLNTDLVAAEGLHYVMLLKSS